MDSQSVHLAIDFVGSSGIVLSPEQRATLQTSLTILQDNQEVDEVQFWGKIIGVREDYYIARGIASDNIFECKLFYSNNCVHWGLLPPATEKTRKISRQLTGRFTGDPSYDCEQKVLRYSENETLEETVSLKEEDRLSAVIAEIDHEAMIVPCGAYIKSSTGKVYRNQNFDGLSVSEAGKLYNYLHVRRRFGKKQNSSINRPKLNPSIDFMDSIEEDIPMEYREILGLSVYNVVYLEPGTWSLQFERGSGLVVLRSLLWLGYTFYHLPETRQYGSVYFGTGERNIDLPFML